MLQKLAVERPKVARSSDDRSTKIVICSSASKQTASWFCVLVMQCARHEDARWKESGTINEAEEHKDVEKTSGCHHHHHHHHRGSKRCIRKPAPTTP
jgi:hypothetical protein